MTETRSSAPSGSALTVLLCFLVMVIEGFDIQAMGVAAPKLGAELKLAKDVLGVALSASNIGLVFGAIAGGWLADRLGRKLVLMAAVATFGAFTLLTMMSHSFDMLFAARMGAGLGFGAALPNVMALAAELGDPKKRGFTGALMFCGMPTGGSAVALLSWLGTDLDWRQLFLIGGVIPLALVPILLFLMKETRRDKPAPSGLNLWVWVAMVPVYGAALVGLEYLGHQPKMGSIGAVAPWLAGVVTLLAAYLAIHRRALFGQGRATASILLWVVFLPTLLILYLILMWLPELVGKKGFPTEASQASMWFNIFAGVGALVLGKLVDRFGIRWPLAFAYLGLIASLIALAQATAFMPIMVLSAAVGFFVLGANYALYGAGAAYYPEAMRGRGAGASIAWGRLGSIAGPLMGGFILQGQGGADGVVYSMAPFAIVAGVGVLALSFLAKPAE